MNKNEFLNQLSNLLSDLSPAERQEAMLYYEDYISDAGEENETSVLQELGTPQKLAADIKAGLGINPTGPQTSGPQNADFASSSSMVIPNANAQHDSSHGQYQQSNTTQEKQKDPTKIALWVLLIIVTSPIWLSIVSAVFSLLLGILSTIVGVVIATLAIGLSFAIVCILLIGLAIVKLFSLPGCSLLLAGIGFIFGGIGIYSLLLCYLLCTKTLPWLFYGSISLCKKCYSGIRKTVMA